MRGINVDGVQYYWKVGKTYVIIRKDRMRVACPTIAEVMGMTPAAVEHDQHKRTLRVSPLHIAEYIRKL